ncbi:hypothetical protein D3C78_500940 [compost metagenome]
MVNTAQFDTNDQNNRQLFARHPVGKSQVITERGKPAPRPFNQHPFSLLFQRPKARREHRKRDWALLIMAHNVRRGRFRKGVGIHRLIRQRHAAVSLQR